MSSNIFGYQGVNTPLESLTNGRYNVADYTTLRAQVESRLNALEKTQSDLENVTINGSLTVLASVTQPGYISAAGNGSFGGTLYSANNLGTAAGLSVAGNAFIGVNLQCNGNELVNGDLVVGGEENLTGDLTVGGLINVSASGIHFSDNTVQTTAAVTPVSPTIYVDYKLYANGGGMTNFVPPSSTNKVTEILFSSNNNCTLNLVNLTSQNESAFPDGVRYVSVYKQNKVNGDYTVTINCPVGSLSYNFFTPSANTTTYVMPLGQYSITFVILSDFYQGNLVDARTVIKSIV